jgi:hypothetical protein
LTWIKPLGGSQAADGADDPDGQRHPRLVRPYS